MDQADRKRGVVRTFLWGATIVLSAWAAADLAGRYLEAGASRASPAILVSIAALCLAAFAAAVAAMAMRSARNSRRDLDTVTRALDVALRARGEKSGVFDIGDINALVAREVERLVARAGPPPADDAGTVAEPAAQPRSGPDTGDVGDTRRLVAEALARGTAEISLRPIVSLSLGAAAAFDVLAHFKIDADRHVDVGRIRDRASSIDLAAFERMLVMEALAASRRIVGGDDAASMRVPVSEALLSARPELSAVLETARAHPSAARSIILDLPSHILAGQAVAADTLDALAMAGFTLGAEMDDDADALDAAALRARGVEWVRVPTPRLLGQRRERPRAMTGHEIADAVREAGMAIMADEVRSDDDAIALVDIGVDLMSGPRFSGPRRLRREIATASRHAAA